jgi:hypothetical protein
MYARFLLQLLAILWPGGLDRSFLRPHITSTSLAIGFSSTVAMSVLTILWAVWSLGRISSSALLAGQTGAVEERWDNTRPRWSRRLALASALAGLGLLGMAWFVRDHEMRALTFFGSAALFLIASLAGFWGWMKKPMSGHFLGNGIWALARLGFRNATRQPMRSLLTTGLLASATFLLVAVETFRRQASEDTSSNGGYSLLAESDVPIFQDLNRGEGRRSLNETLERHLRDQFSSNPRQFQEQLASTQELLNKVTLVPFRVRPGDDASCLNLYQPHRPRLLGVPPSFIEEDGFRFANSLAHTQNQRHNPWSLLEQPLDDDALPVIGEANTVIWMLKSGLGKDLTVRDERGQETRLRIVGLLQDSIFQSGLLLSEANFLKLFPSQGGDSFFLIKAPPGLDADVKILLETALGKHGFEVTPTGERLGAYWAVENTYLTTFQALGGLGLLMGTIGLAVVLLRSIWERRGELALLRALGYRARALDWLLLFENGFLLLLGMGAGTATALLAVMPHLLGSASQVPWWRLIILLTLALAIGLVTQSVALVFTLRTPLLAALRRE